MVGVVAICKVWEPQLRHHQQGYNISWHFGV